MSSSGMGRDVHSLTLSIQLLPLPTAASSILQGGLKDGAGEAVVAPSAPLSSMNPMCLKKRGYSQTQETGPCQEYSIAQTLPGTCRRPYCQNKHWDAQKLKADSETYFLHSGKQCAAGSNKCTHR